MNTHSRIHTCMLSIIHINAYIDMYRHANVHTYVHPYRNTFMHAYVHTYIHTIGLNARWQTDWAIEDQAKNLNSTARPYDQRAFSPLDPTARWLSHLALAIYVCYCYFRCSGTGKRFSNRKETSYLPLLNARFETGSPEPNLQLTECPLTNRLSYRGSS